MGDDDDRERKPANRKERSGEAAAAAAGEAKRAWEVRPMHAAAESADPPMRGPLAMSVTLRRAANEIMRDMCVGSRLADVCRSVGDAAAALRRRVCVWSVPHRTDRGSSRVRACVPFAAHRARVRGPGGSRPPSAAQRREARPEAEERTAGTGEANDTHTQRSTERTRQTHTATQPALNAASVATLRGRWSVQQQPLHPHSLKHHDDPIVL